MAKRGSRWRQAVGRGLVALIPRLLGALATIGTAAMLWVGGQIFLHGLDEFHIGGVGHALHDLDRKSGGEGKSVVLRVDPGGRRIIKKKNTIVETTTPSMQEKEERQSQSIK